MLFESREAGCFKKGGCLTYHDHLRQVSLHTFHCIHLVPGRNFKKLSVLMSARNMHCPHTCQRVLDVDLLNMPHIYTHTILSGYVRTKVKGHAYGSAGLTKPRRGLITAGRS